MSAQPPNLGDFDVACDPLTLSVDNRIVSSNRVIVYPSTAPGNALIKIGPQSTENPIDLRNAFIRVTGSVTKSDGTALEQCVHVHPFSMNNIFTKAVIKFGSGEQIVETIDNFPINLQARQLLMTDWNRMVNGGMSDQGICVPPMTSSAFGMIKDAIASPSSDKGNYNAVTGSHLLNSDGTFEIIFYLRSIFESINTLENIYKNLKVSIELTPNNYVSHMTSSVTGSTGIYHSATATAVGEAAKTAFYSKFVITETSLHYDEIVLDGQIYQMVASQYAGDVQIPYRVMRLAFDSINAGSSQFTCASKIQSGKFGFHAFGFFFRDSAATADGAKLSPKDGYPTLMTMPVITKIQATYCGKHPIDIDLKTAADPTNVLSRPFYVALYNYYVESASSFGLDESQVIPYLEWIRRFPIIVIPMSNFAAASNSSQEVELKVNFKDKLTSNLDIFYFGLADEVGTLSKERNFVAIQK